MPVGTGEEGSTAGYRVSAFCFFQVAGIPVCRLGGSCRHFLDYLLQEPTGVLSFKIKYAGTPSNWGYPLIFRSAETYQKT